MLRPRELNLLKLAAGAPLPRELRGLLDIRSLSHSSPQHIPLTHWVALVARRIADAALAPEFSGIEAEVGFAALRHLNGRVAALRHLVYDTNSHAERFGIRVRVQSSYQGADRERFFFRYQVRINNASQDTVQLLSRAWTIRDLDGRVTSVEGPGVVGAFPTLEPKESYEYSSAVPLSTPVGTQSGHYVFIAGAQTFEGAEEMRKKMLQVPVAPFSYRSPTMDLKREGRSGADGGRIPSATKARGRRRRTDDLRRR